MSWQDRPYAQRDDQYGGFTGGGPTVARRWGSSTVVTKLIVVNIAMFVVTLLTGQQGHPAYSPIFDMLAMKTPAVLHGQVWRLITSDYLHFDIMHILFNMYALWLFGSMVERVWGGRQFFIMYTIAGIIGSLVYFGLNLLGIVGGGIAAGASGCVLGVVGACAVMFPRNRLLIWGVFPVTIRALGILYGLFSIFVISSQGYNAGGEACHLGGLVFGAWWAYGGHQWWVRRSRGARPASTTAGVSDVLNSLKSKLTPAPDDATVDRILQKVHDHGIQSLSQREKDTLAAASDQQRQESAARQSRRH